MRGFLRFATTALVVMALIAAGMVIFFGDTPTPSQETVDTIADTESGVVAKSDPTTGRRAPSKLVGETAVAVPDTMPASLAGTSVPGGWDKTDANGSLVPTPQLRQLFEYYLAALGEETLPQLVARIEQALARLEEPARSEALDTLGDYLDYKLALGDLEATYGHDATTNAEDMQRRMAEIRALRRTWMDAQTADAFFATDEAVDQFQVEQLRIRTDPSLSEREREQALAKAEKALPEPLRQARQETRKFTDYQRARSEFADDPDALRAWRKERFGAEAARELEKVEVEQQAWEAKWQSYSQDLAKLGDMGLAGPERKAAIDALRDDYFEGAEKLRAEALDSLR